MKFAQTPEEAEAKAGEILGMKLVTKQTGPEGRIVKRVLVSQGRDEIAREYYVVADQWTGAREPGSDDRLERRRLGNRGVGRRKRRRKYTRWRSTRTWG